MKMLKLLALAVLSLNQLYAKHTDKKIIEKIDLVYKSVSDWDGKLDLYLPNGQHKKMH